MPGAKPGSMWRSSRARSCLRLVAANPRDSFPGAACDEKRRTCGALGKQSATVDFLSAILPVHRLPPCERKPRDRRRHDRPTLAPRVRRSSSSCANVSTIASAAPVPAASRASFEE